MCIYIYIIIYIILCIYIFTIIYILYYIYIIFYILYIIQSIYVCVTLMDAKKESNHPWPESITLPSQGWNPKIHVASTPFSTSNNTFVSHTLDPGLKFWGSPYQPAINLQYRRTWMNFATLTESIPICGAYPACSETHTAVRWSSKYLLPTKNHTVIPLRESQPGSKPAIPVVPVVPVVSSCHVVSISTKYTK